MRLVPPGMVSAFYGGDYSGDKRNFARVTIQHGGTKLFHLPYNLYASSIFGSDDPPKELPNIKSVVWGRATSQDFANCTCVFYNTKPMELGEKPTRDVDFPGYYTYNRGKTQFSSRWGVKANEWQKMLMPDNILRTYEGYGFDPTTIPEEDPNLVSTGVWRIDTVEYTHDGLITVTCRDIGSILGDEILFPPVVPHNFWPVSFTADPNQDPGFVGPHTGTKTTDTATISRSSSWTGPTGGPATTSVTESHNKLDVDWTRPTRDDDDHYKVIGYQVALDGILLSTIYKHTNASLTVPHGIHDGNVYSIRVVAWWQDVKTKDKAMSDYGPEKICRPHDTGGPAVTTGSIAINVDETDTVSPGAVRFQWTGGAGTFTVIAYKGDKRQVFKKAMTGSSGFNHITTTGLGDMTTWNFLVYGVDSSGATGKGEVYFAASGGEYYAAPASGATPSKAATTKGATVKSKKGSTSKPLKAVDVKLKFSNTSNSYYVGAGKEVAVYGHTPAMAFTPSSDYWLSIGNERNDQGYSYEWVEADCSNVTLTSVTVKTAKDHYGIYLSVFSDGKWVQHPNTGIIPYNPALPESHNGANIPYAEYVNQGSGETQTIDLRDPIPKVTKVRVTFHNLKYFDATGMVYHYRAGVRYLSAKGQSGGGNTGKPATTGKSKDKVSSTTKFTPAHVRPGLGAYPGMYDDYTDIVKLLCAWGGFYWPAGAYVVWSDGSQTSYDWGTGPYGLPNVDPVLGDVDGGRDWGDFEQTGTAGVTPLPIDVWMQKSLMDGISYIRDIIGFIFYIDEDGAVCWRRPNYFAIGNWINNNPVEGPERFTDVVVIDEEITLIGLRATLSSANLRERIFVATVDGKTGALAKGYNPNPTGLRRVGGWTDQYFSSTEECQVMADLIAVQQLFGYRTDTVTIPGYPAIQIDDQVIVIEQVTGEGFYHYVSGIDSNNDLEAGGWTYDLTTNWLGERPFDMWAFSPKKLSKETQTYLDALDYGVPNTLPPGAV